METKSTALIPDERIEKVIHIIRSEKVILDADLAKLYEVTTSELNQAVRRNMERFPPDFMFQLSNQELNVWRSQFVISKPEAKMGLRRRPFAFTEQGVAMLSALLKSQRAVHVSIEIVRTFIKLRQLLASNAELARKLDALERKYDGQFQVVFNTIRELMKPPQPAKRRPLGFGR